MQPVRCPELPKSSEITVYRVTFSVTRVDAQPRLRPYRPSPSLHTITALATQALFTHSQSQF
jgi:hypothetical protein